MAKFRTQQDMFNPAKLYYYSVPENEEVGSVEDKGTHFVAIRTVSEFTPHPRETNFNGISQAINFLFTAPKGKIKSKADAKQLCFSLF